MHYLAWRAKSSGGGAQHAESQVSSFHRHTSYFWRPLRAVSIVELVAVVASRSTELQPFVVASLVKWVASETSAWRMLTVVAARTLALLRDIRKAKTSSPPIPAPQPTVI
eukprot:6172548-Pleurochrysis_carterae.AAC.2